MPLLKPDSTPHILKIETVNRPGGPLWVPIMGANRFYHKVQKGRNAERSDLYCPPI